MTSPGPELLPTTPHGGTHGLSTASGLHFDLEFLDAPGDGAARVRLSARD